MMTPIVDELMLANTSIVQLPCPERDILGVDREPMNKDEVPLEKFKVYLKNAVKIAGDQIEDYLSQEYQILAVIGKRGSPFCGVEKSWITKGNLANASGYLMEDLKRLFESKGWAIPFFEYDTNEPEKSTARLKALL